MAWSETTLKHLVPILAAGQFVLKKEAQEILLELYTALHGGSRCYEMPHSRRRMEEPVVKDARVKRRGGS